MTPATETPADYKKHMLFPASTAAVRKALDKMFKGMEPLALPVEERGTIELVLAEVLNNIVEHAYKNAADGSIDLTISLRNNGFLFEVSDEGCEMPDGKAPLGDRVLLDSDLSALPEGGFGWFLIRDLARDLQYRRAGGRNLLSFRIAVGVPAIYAN